MSDYSALLHAPRVRKGALKGLSCAVPSCTESAHARAMCKRHYLQAIRGGEVRSDRRGMHGTPTERFWHWVEKGEPDACWLWQGKTDKDGYGTLKDGAKLLRAHRISFEFHKGPIPDGHLIRHSCHTPGCVNPRHLSAGTHLDNMQDKVLAGRVPRNEAHANCKFSNEVVAAVRVATGKRKDIAKQFGMSESQVTNVRLGRQRKPAAADVDDRPTAEELERAGQRRLLP